MKPITRALAADVLRIVDAGLVQGVGVAEPGKMCVEAAVCFALGLPHGDDPPCVSPAIRSLKITLNDADWSSPEARATGMRRLAIMQLGTHEGFNDVEFAKRVAMLAVTKILPRALALAASAHADPLHREDLLRAGRTCAEADGLAAASDASDAASDAARAARAASDASAAASDASDAASDAARAARAASDASAAAYAARAAASDAASAAAYAARAAAYAARAAASDAASAASDAASDEELAFMAEEVVQILVAMGAPGIAWLDLTESTQQER